MARSIETLKKVGPIVAAGIEGYLTFTGQNPQVVKLAANTADTATPAVVEPAATAVASRTRDFVRNGTVGHIPTPDGITAIVIQDSTPTATIAIADTTSQDLPADRAGINGYIKQSGDANACTPDGFQQVLATNDQFRQSLSGGQEISQADFVGETTFAQLTRDNTMSSPIKFLRSIGQSSISEAISKIVTAAYRRKDNSVGWYSEEFGTWSTDQIHGRLNINAPLSEADVTYKSGLKDRVLWVCDCINRIIPKPKPSTATFTSTKTETATPTLTSTPIPPSGGEQHPGPGPQPTPSNTPTRVEVPTATATPVPPTATQTREATATPQEVTPTNTPKVSTPTATKEASATPQPTPAKTSTKEASATPQPTPVKTSTPKRDYTATPQTNPETPSPVVSNTPISGKESTATPSSDTKDPSPDPVTTPVNVNQPSSPVASSNNPDKSPSQSPVTSPVSSPAAPVREGIATPSS